MTPRVSVKVLQARHMARLAQHGNYPVHHNRASRHSSRTVKVVRASAAARARDAHRRLVLRNRHHDLARMQVQAGRVGARHELNLARAALARRCRRFVAEDRQAHRGAMHAQLMRAPGDGLQREPASCLRSAARPSPSTSSPPAALRIGLHPPAARSSSRPSGRSIVPSSVVGPAFDHRPVGLADACRA